MFDGHQISVQLCSSNQGIGEILNLYAQGDSLYASENSFRNLNSTEDLCKDNINNNRQSEKQESSSDSKQCRQHSVPDAGSVIVGEGNRVDSIGVQEIWIGDQREQEQVEAGITNCVPGMDVQLNNNENLIGQRGNEGVESISSKINQANNGRKIVKDQKHGKFGWQAQVFHSIIQTRMTASITNKQINEQCCESNGLDKQNDSNEEVLDRTILMDDTIGKPQTKDDRQEIELDNNIDGRVNFRIRSECDQEQHADQKDIRIMGSGYGEFELTRDTGDIQIDINTERNKEADALSRLSMAGDYLLRKEVQEDVCKDGQVEITVDLFAAKNNAKHKRCYTLGKDKKAEG
ncbi:MAG: hypothetical protein EZS28_036605 [Streblomastix strix]|uniref:Uncharacterized protein n=1 Tax=Streblomastix strix TaxID=222440 RepID=A0A5J4UBL9_9EUKA|nr:MAG: hypothetical protein EZS28_036605 [Streblomastix strix]